MTRGKRRRLQSHVNRPPQPGEWVPVYCWCQTRIVTVPVELVAEGLTVSHDQDQTCTRPND